MPPKQEPPAKDWCFRIFDTPEVSFDDLFQKVWALEYKYITFQIEVGVQNHPHIQGFVQFHDKVRKTALIKLIPQAHWEKRKGTPYEAAHYAQKPVPDCNCERHCKDLVRFDENYEDGFLSVEMQYKVHEVTQTIKTHGLSKAIRRFPEAYLSFHQGMEKLATFYSPKRDFQTIVTVCYGQPDAGKTRYAMLGRQPYKLASFGSKGQNDFFGDYRPDEHQTLVVDDFYSNWMYTTFLQACDRYPMEVHTKGGFRPLLVRHIVFTSNLPPDKWYPNILADVYRSESFHRRIHNIIFFHKIGYQLIKGELPWELPYLRRLTPDDYLMNPHILDFQTQGFRPVSRRARRNWRQGSQSRSASSQSVDEQPSPFPVVVAGGHQTSAQNVRDHAAQHNPALLPFFGPETYQEFVARRTPNF